MGESRAGRTRLRSAGEAAQGWSELHYGLDPGRVLLVRWWLRLMWLLARPLARAGVPPLAITLTGVLLALAATLSAGELPWPALVLVLAAVVCDGLDGAVAVVASRASAFGSAADKIADRVSDCAFALVLWRCGAPWWLAFTAGLLSLAHEGFRALAGGRLLSLITVAERPSRVVCAVLACGSSGVSSAQWPPSVCAATWCVLACVGLVQLWRARP
jgi:CDP-diacylglycerol--glycerol-3-phosphate 3-phosphatidyltransferase